ncbi:hypothetical protein Pryu01_02073 [Paraliobacillus ryukyuensis]|uniref:Apea-like HEPN domain-containing protein n=1 Tax=Paraliobacillus ryukyuensis TaxID=200904 RepID=A0A366E6S9_9BACI|nr:hypothetical protein [Paraliobacillus ryukyuensis]RBO97194.1 hypothetical protein DES48_107113 [Paraliobacillus ryukyuensis]
MVVLDIYGKIERTMISDKLKLFIANLPDDWKDTIKEDIFEEIRRIEFNRKEQQIKYGKVLTDVFDYTKAKKIVETNIETIKGYSLDTLENCIDCILENMIFIEFDYDYNDMPFFDWTTNCFDGRLCEEDYSEKIVKLLNFMKRKNHFRAHFNVIYSSNNDYFSVIPRITTALALRTDSEFKGFRIKDEAISDFKKCGECIDDFLQTESDYYKLDFIVEALNKGDDYKHYHFLKTFTVLEMLLLNKNQQTNEIDNYINPIIKQIYSEESEQATKLLRQMRNKVGHGDFKGFNKKAYEFADKYMKSYQFDYSEYSHLNWILLHTCCLLDDILKEVLIEKFNIDRYFQVAHA